MSDATKSKALQAIDDELEVLREAINAESVVLQRMQAINAKLWDLRAKVIKAEAPATWSDPDAKVEPQ